MKAYVGICVLAPAPLAQVKPDLYDGLKWRNIASFHGGRISAFSGSLTEPGGVRDIKVESPTLMWGKMASCGRMVSDLCGFLSTARKADYQSAARCHLAPQRGRAATTEGNPHSQNDRRGVYRSTDGGLLDLSVMTRYRPSPSVSY